MTTTKTMAHNELSTPPPEVIDQEAIRKQYENMSYNEMSQRIAESYKQLSEILGNRISLSDNTSSTTDDAADDIISDEESSDLTEQKLTKLFLKSVSTGNVDKVNEYLKNPLLDINGKDEDGTTALIYATCFGKFEIAQALLLAGAKIDNQDSRK
jgi:ankyrin repeat protein